MTIDKTWDDSTRSVARYRTLTAHTRRYSRV
jgi:hypothetical protein